MNVSLEFAHKFLTAYGVKCQSLCQEIRMPQTAFDILMFLANNPEYKTARDIVEIRGIKANLVSVNVNKLVQDGYLERKSIPSDRRKILLECTGKARPVIDRGRRLQNTFFEDIFRDIDAEAKMEFYHVIKAIGSNLDRILEEPTTLS